MPIGKGFKPQCTLSRKVNTMRHEELAKLLDGVENSCVRAEQAKKDVDLLVALRTIYKILEGMIKDDGRSKND